MLISLGRQDIRRDASDNMLRAFFQPALDIAVLIASEVGVNLKDGYNGDLTSREAGSVGGQMVKKMSTVRTVNFTRKDRTAMGHEIEVRYIAGIMV